jgi:hypothetical protein
MIRPGSLLKECWNRLREWSGDDAYDRYLGLHREHAHAHKVLSKREFYRQYFDRRGKRPRCC